MVKVTSKLQITIPKRIADEFGIRPGDQLEFVPRAGGTGWCPPAAAASPG
jgi:AbrB family looped-hinge helix DNA binding protein